MLQVEEIGTVGERILQLINYFASGNKTAFGRAAGLQSGLLAGIIGSRQSKPSFEVLQKILTGYPSINPIWLLFGRGPMLHEADSEAASNQSTAPTPLLAPEQMQELARHMYRLEMADDRLRAVREEARAQAEANYLQRTYHLGKEATPGLDYDDRLIKRLIPFNESEILTWLKRPEEKGGIRHIKEGDKYMVTEAALREWAGDAPKRNK